MKNFYNDFLTVYTIFSLLLYSFHPPRSPSFPPNIYSAPKPNHGCCYCLSSYRVSSWCSEMQVQTRRVVQLFKTNFSCNRLFIVFVKTINRFDKEKEIKRKRLRTTRNYEECLNKKINNNARAVVREREHKRHNNELYCLCGREPRKWQWNKNYSYCLFYVFLLLLLLVVLFAHLTSLPASFLIRFQSFFESHKLSLFFIIVDDFQLDLAWRFRFVYNSILANDCSCHFCFLLIYI